LKLFQPIGGVAARLTFRALAAGRAAAVAVAAGELLPAGPAVAAVAGAASATTAAPAAAIASQIDLVNDELLSARRAGRWCAGQ
jgi:hypothetical protein